jgi:hypothetical protein
MAESHMVSGLKTTRAEKLGELAQLRERMDLLEADAMRVEKFLTHIDAVLKEVAPGIELETIKPVRVRSKPNAGKFSTNRGKYPSGAGPQVPTHVMRVMREAETPMTTTEIIDAVMELREGDDRTRVSHCVHSCLTQKTRDGLFIRTVDNDNIARYSIRA